MIVYCCMQQKKNNNTIKFIYYAIFAGTIGVVAVTIVLVPFIIISGIHAQQDLKRTQLEDKTSQLMVAADGKLQEARTLGSKKDTTPQDQTRMKELLQEAVSDAKQAVDKQPKNVKTWDFLGKVYLQISGINPQAAALAEDAFKQTLRLDANKDQVYTDLATAQIQQKKYSEAVPNLQKAIKINSKEANYHFMLGNTYRALGQIENAKKAYLAAKKLTPKDDKNNALIDYQLKTLDEKTKKQ